MWIAIAVISALVTVAAAMFFATYTVLFLIAVCGILLLRRRYELLVPLTLFLAATTLPNGIPAGFAAGGYAFKLYEPVLVAAFIWAVTRPVAKPTTRVVAALVAWLGVGLIGALLVSAQLGKVIADIRYPVEMVMAVAVAAAAVTTPDLGRMCARTMKWSLWISAAFIMLASAGVLTLVGRSEIATLFETTGDGGATRYLTAATFFALTTLCVCLALAVSGTFSLAQTWMWTVPALLILFLAFSRNHILGIAVTLLLAILAARSAGAVGRTTIRVAVGALVIFGVLTVSPMLSGLPGGEWFATQIDGYSSRVVDGLRSDALARDDSARYREREIGNLERAFYEDPVVGHGFGFAYQRPQGSQGTFWYDRAPYYSHNFYWWMMVKTGVVGLLLFLLATLVPVVKGTVWSKNPVAVALAASLGGLLAICWVAPLPLDSPTSALVGSALGALVGLLTSRQRDSVTTVEFVDQYQGHVTDRQAESVDGVTAGTSAMRN
ncbi:O-antigen ligase family protein [Rhodococcus sp. WAY2]|uniref:O-antigen ligase family protein n=1 Tax=Rhodococcus sp. WAY2 TaxID=2663121 RepID=UPI001357926F|nr:O-antigen ligase family protein [Rhodococcus sp. WAY2]